MAPAPVRRPPDVRLKNWLKANWQFVRQLKLALLMGFMAEMVFGAFAGALDPEMAASLHGISFEVGIIIGLYADPDEWHVP